LLAAASAIVDSERSALPGDDFSGAEVNEFDDTIVVEEDVWKD
jgi:hypothetical protein